MKFQEIADLDQAFKVTSNSENESSQMVGTVTDSYHFDSYGNEAWRGGLLRTISQLNEIVFNSGEAMFAILESQLVLTL